MKLPLLALPWLWAAGGACVLAAAPDYPPLARFDAAAQAAVQARLQQPIDAERAAQLALLQHPSARLALLELGSTPNALLAVGLLDPTRFDAWQVLASANTRLDSGRSSQLVELQVIAHTAQQAWVEAAAAQALLPLLDQAQTAHQAQVELARSRRAAGTLARLDEAETNAEAAEAELAVQDGHAAAQIALSHLRLALGLPLGSSLQLSPLAAPPHAAPELAGLLAQARLQNHALRQALGEARRVPDSEQNALQQRPLSLPLLDGRNALGHRDNQLAARLKAERSILQAEAELSERRSRYLQALQRWQLLQDRILPERRTARSEMLKHYNGMLRGVDALLESSQAELTAQQQLIEAQRDAWLAWLALEQSVGGRLPVPAPTDAAPGPAPNPAPMQPMPHTMHRHGHPQPPADKVEPTQAAHH